MISVSTKRDLSILKRELYMHEKDLCMSIAVWSGFRSVVYGWTMCVTHSKKCSGRNTSWPLLFFICYLAAILFDFFTASLFTSCAIWVCVCVCERECVCVCAAHGETQDSKHCDYQNLWCGFSPRQQRRTRESRDWDQNTLGIRYHFISDLPCPWCACIGAGCSRE